MPAENPDQATVVFKTRWRENALFASDNPRDRTKYFGAEKKFIVPRKSIAAHTNPRVPQRIGCGYDAMGDEPSVSSVQQNFAYCDLLLVASLD